MTLTEEHKGLLNKVPRRVNECWLGDLAQDKGVYVVGYQVLVCLEGTALRIWQLMDGTRSLVEMTETLAKEYRATSPEVILEGTIACLLKLEGAGLAAWQTRPLFEDIELDD